MKSFSYDISPIKNKKYQLFALNTEEEIHKDRDYSYLIKSKLNKTHALSIIPLYDQHINSAAKTIIYLFSPEIDIIDNIASDFSNYDKFHKTKEILNELVIRFRNNNSELEYQIISKIEEIQNLSIQVEELNKQIQVLKEKNHFIEQQSGKYKDSIIVLSEAYEEAKECFEKEVLQIRIENKQVRHLYQRQLQKRSLRNKSKNDKNQKKKEKSQQKQQGGYSDESIYKRFSVLNSLDKSENTIKIVEFNRNLSIVLNSDKSLDKKRQKSSQRRISKEENPNFQESRNKSKNLIQQHREIDSQEYWSTKLIQLQQKCGFFEHLINELEKKKQIQISKLHKQMQEKDNKLEKSQRKIRQKNKIIIELMNDIDRR